MSEEAKYVLNKASEVEIAKHLARCDAEFIPPLSRRVEIIDYAKKIANKAVRFEAWYGDSLVGLVAVYCNNREQRIAYITSVSVLHEWTGKGIAASLLKQSIEYAKAAEMQQISLEVATKNTSAIKLYEKSGFAVGKVNGVFVSMVLNLKNGKEHE